MQPETAVNLIYKELQIAEKKFDSFKNIHHGFGVITEEYHEFLSAIRDDGVEQIILEVCHLGAMCVRFLTDIFPEPTKSSNSDLGRFYKEISNKC